MFTLKENKNNDIKLKKVCQQLIISGNIVLEIDEDGIVTEPDEEIILSLIKIDSENSIIYFKFEEYDDNYIIKINIQDLTFDVKTEEEEKNTVPEDDYENDVDDDDDDKDSHKKSRKNYHR